MAAPRRLPALLFDLDGTLIDSIELILASARHCFAASGRPAPSDAEWAATIGVPLAGALRPYALDDADLALMIQSYRAYQVANHDRLTRCYDGIVDVITTLHERGHEIAIVTSKGDALAMRGLVHVGLARYVDTIVGCDSTARHKPDPEPVQVALTRLGADPRDAIFAGDSIHDIEAGNAAGVRTIATLWGAGARASFAPANPTRYAETIAELVAIIDDWTAAVE